MILVSGGTGMLGRRLLPRLTAQGHDVRVLTRDPAAAADLAGPSVEVVAGDLRDPASVSAAVEGADTVVAAAHGFVGPRGVSPATVDRDGNAHLVDAATGAGAAVVLMSIVGAGPDHPMELMRMKYAAEQHLIGSGAPWSIVRATAFAELWIGLLRQTAAKGGRPLVFGRGDALVNFVAVDDVAALLASVVTDPSTRGQAFDIGGPDNLSFNELAELVQQADGRTGSPKHVPRPVLHLMAHTVGVAVPQLGRQVRGALAMDAGDRPFDSSAVHQRFPDLPSTPVVDVLAATPAH